MLLFGCGIALVLSLCANVFLWLKIKAPNKEPSYDARLLIHDLTRGDALVRVSRVNPEDVLLRSPRGIA